MPVEFVLDEVSVANFRGIRDCHIKFPRAKPTHLVGSNNAGKTTILQSIAFAFKSAGFYQYDVKPFDFYKSVDGDHCPEFAVTVSFSATREEYLPAVQAVGNPKFVHAVAARGKTSKDGRLSKHFNLLGADQKPILLSPRTALKGEIKEQFSDHGLGWTQVYARHEDIREHLPEVMLLTPDNIHSSLFVWKSGPLNRISSLLAERILTDEWVHRDRAMPEAIRAAHRFLASAVSHFPYWREEIRPRFAETLGSYLGKTAKIELQPTIQTVEEWIQQQLLLSFAGDDQGTITPIESMGDGWRSLIRLAALDVLSKLESPRKRGTVLLFEEPETHLHPHLRRRMRNVLEELASVGWCVVTTTHASEMVSLATSQKVVKVLRTGADVKCTEYDTTETPAALRIQSKLDERGSGELFFANKVVICEGRDDQFALTVWLESFGIDLESQSISVLGVGSKDNIPDYIALLQSIGTPWCAVFDQDKLPDGTYKKNAEEFEANIARLCVGRNGSYCWQIDLEHCYGVQRSAQRVDRPARKADPNWQAALIRGASKDDLVRTFPMIASVVSGIAEWIREES